MADNDDEEGFRSEEPDKVVPMPRRSKRPILFEKLFMRTSSNYLIKGMIPRMGLVVAWGPPKCGKSFWVFDMVMHIAMGREYRGHRVRQGTVVYCAFEGSDGFLQRIEAVRQQYGVANVPFYLMPENMDLAAEVGQLISGIRAECAAPVVVVLDTLNRSLVGSENNDEDMARYVKATDRIRAYLGCAVIIVHHCGTNESRPRGHTSLTGAIDTQIAIKRDTAGNVVATVEMNKDGPFGEVITSRLKQVELGPDDEGDQITSCVIEPAEETDGVRRREVPKSAKQAFRLLADAINDVGTVIDNARIPAGTRSVPVETWRSYCYAGTIADTGKQDSKKKAFQRAVRDLQNAALIGVWNERVWMAGQTGQAGT